ncbi:MAG: hypothetical protein ACREUK_05095, partial [Burkholderiales bacterium]
MPRHVDAALAACAAADLDPWQRLETACVAHLEALLDGGDYAQVIVRVRPGEAPGAATRLI